MSYTPRSLDASTWDLFAELVERNNGVYGGCWCIAYHLERKTKLDHRATKQELVQTGQAHAALVIDEDGLAQGWAQYGSPAELPGIKHRREYEKDGPPLPDWRITCVFVDSKHRGQGVARTAVQAALDQIAERGGGRVEAISEVTDGRQAQAGSCSAAQWRCWRTWGSNAADRSANTPGSSAAPSDSFHLPSSSAPVAGECRYGRGRRRARPMSPQMPAAKSAAIPPAQTHAPAAGLPVSYPPIGRP